ncbi:MAG: UDP-N-acetylmuramoyl-L-alanine--D-glutamate ligase [Patescibacteria group bacterium]|nr:UDP-N-acetylmuramoyl-L-alanine--D-glutamate ligase [Patescibacteria group bacterium]
MDFKNKKIAVIGFGVEGKSSAGFLTRKGAEVTALDKKNGNNYLGHLEKYDLIVRSPGVKFNEILNSKSGIQKSVITSQTKLFFDLCPCKIIGVTGTKGKGTTASLIYEMLKISGKDVYLGGNIGQPPFDFLDNLNSQSWVILELSSFQLQDLTKSPHIAVVLMITSEHLDYHKDLSDYVESKRNILRFQTSSDFAIINRDYPASNESDIQTDGKVYFISREREVQMGCFAREGKVVIRTEAGDEEIIDTDQILIPGEHNFENICAAVITAKLAGASLESIRKVLKTFKGLEHRLELVGTVNGISYYDDSYSTTPETAIAAIQAFKKPEVLILGGSSKGSDFGELGQIISKAENIRAIIGIGEEWSKIKDAILKTKTQKLIIEGAKNMPQIVKAASKIAQPGDIVLLSPACASFGMFKNYKDRGEQFKREVEKLKS